MSPAQRIATVVVDMVAWHREEGEDGNPIPFGSRIFERADFINEDLTDILENTGVTVHGIRTREHLLNLTLMGTPDELDFTVVEHVTKYLNRKGFRSVGITGSRIDWEENDE